MRPRAPYRVFEKVIGICFERLLTSAGPSPNPNPTKEATVAAAATTVRGKAAVAATATATITARETTVVPATATAAAAATATEAATATATSATVNSSSSRSNRSRGSSSLSSMPDDEGSYSWYGCKLSQTYSPNVGILRLSCRKQCSGRFLEHLVSSTGTSTESKTNQRHQQSCQSPSITKKKKSAINTHS